MIAFKPVLWLIIIAATFDSVCGLISVTVSRMADACGRWNKLYVHKDLVIRWKNQFFFCDDDIPLKITFPVHSQWDFQISYCNCYNTKSEHIIMTIRLRCIEARQNVQIYLFVHVILFKMHKNWMRIFLMYFLLFPSLTSI